MDRKINQSTNIQAPNFIYVPNYDCNLKCYYCFEEAFDKKIDKKSVADDAENLFMAIEKTINILQKTHNTVFKSEDIKLDITGGEPLLERNLVLIEEILRIANKKNYSCGIVTNGTTIEKYIQLFKQFPKTSVQITLDGAKSIHDGIRVFKNDQGSFDLIMSNIRLLSKVIDDLSIRINVSKKNIESIKYLAEYIDKLKNVKFYAYLMQQEGCSDSNSIINELDGLQYLEEEKSIFKNLNNLFISYHGYNLVNGIFSSSMFIPKVSVCTAMTNQYILDYKGDIYKCWWDMGKVERRIGKFDKEELWFDNEKVSLFLNRKVTNMCNCKNCKYRYVCGGGCTGVMGDKELLASSGICPNFNQLFNYIIKKRYIEVSE